MACRSLDRANEAISKIRQNTGEGTMIPLCLDLCSLDSIEKFADKIKDEYSNFNCLIENAGLAVNGDEKTVEGHEIHFGVNHLGHFFLTDLLKDVIKDNKSRVVVVSSRMHERATIDFDNLGKYVAPKPGDRMNHMYNNSKLMNFYFARQLYKQGYDAHVLCPGLCHTDFFRHYNPKVRHRKVIKSKNCIKNCLSSGITTSCFPRLLGGIFGLLNKGHKISFMQRRITSIQVRKILAMATL